MHSTGAAGRMRAMETRQGQTTSTPPATASASSLAGSGLPAGGVYFHSTAFDKPRCFAAGEAGRGILRAAGRVAANNGSALFAFASVPTGGCLSGLIIPAPPVREGNQVAQALGGLQSDSRGGRKPFAGGGVESRHALVHQCRGLDALVIAITRGSIPQPPPFSVSKVRLP